MRIFRDHRTYVILMAVVLASAMRAQSPVATRPSVVANASSKFEVVAIKRGDPAARLGGKMDVDKPDRFSATDTPMRVLLRYAYDGLSNNRIAGAPDWFATTRFSIVAKAERAVTPAEKKEMVRALLTERFALQLHEASMELAHYALVLDRTDGRLGPNLRRSTDECIALSDEMSRTHGMDATLKLIEQHPACRSESVFPETKGQTLSRLGAFPVSGLARMLEGFSDRPVVDQTGLRGRFDVVINGRFEDLMYGATPDTAPSSRPSIFTALPEQLGLKLESRRGPVSVFVVDRVELPTYD